MKKYLVLIVILAILVVIAFLLEFPRIGSGPSSRVFVAVEPTAAAFITISQGPSSLTLERTLEGWAVSAGGAEYPADPARLEGIFAVTESIEGDVVSVNPDNHSIFGVDSESATLVTVTDKNDSTLASLLLGRPSKDFTSTYVRRATSEDVYAVAGFLKSYFRTDIDFYRRRTVFDFAEADLETLELIYPRRSFTLARDATGEMVLIQPEDTFLDSTYVDQSMRVLSGLTAAGFHDNAMVEETGFRNPGLRAVLVMRGGSRDTLFVGNRKGDSYYARRSGDPTTYLLSKPIAERFLKDLDDHLER
jgi:hypothetical protein